MGFSIDRFLEPVDPNLLCGICSGVLEHAVLTPCGHSFCQLCLETWLERPATHSCPECRSHVSYQTVKPVLALRNLIGAMDICCEHSDRGCKVRVKVERARAHLDACPYIPVVCAGCSETINRFELAAHQMQCAGIAATVADDVSPPSSVSPPSWRRYKDSGDLTSEMMELLCRLSTMELQMEKIKRDLRASEARNSSLERDLRKTKEELKLTKSQMIEMQFTEGDPTYEYGHTPQSMAKLSLLLARYLLRKPPHLDRDAIFAAVKRCYETYFRHGDEYEHDVHMLLATAYASNWFSSPQRLSLNCWLHCIARYRIDTRVAGAHAVVPRLARPAEGTSGPSGTTAS